MMKRNLKPLGLSLVAAMALGAVMASGASAEFTYEFGVVSWRVTPTVNTEIVSSESSLSCSGLTGAGGPSLQVEKEATVEPKYSGCTITIGSLGTLGAEIDTNGCHYLFTTDTEVGLHLLCPEGKQMEITAKILGTFRKCLDIHAQTPTSPFVHYRNQLNATTNKWDVEFETTVSGTTTEKTGSCAFGTIEENGATLSGKVTYEGIKGGGEPGNMTHS